MSHTTTRNGITYGLSLGDGAENGHDWSEWMNDNLSRLADLCGLPLVLLAPDARFPNARVLTAGTNITLDLSEPGKVIITAAGGSGAVTTGALRSPSGLRVVSPSGAPLVPSAVA